MSVYKGVRSNREAEAPLGRAHLYSGKRSERKAQAYTYRNPHLGESIIGRREILGALASLLY